MANASTEAARTKRTPHVSIKTGDNVKFSQTADCQPLHLGHLDDQDVGAFVSWQIHLRKVAFRYVPGSGACLSRSGTRTHRAVLPATRGMRAGMGCSLESLHLPQFSESRTQSHKEGRGK